jgi:hypothetical protein
MGGLKEPRPLDDSSTAEVCGRISWDNAGRMLEEGIVAGAVAEGRLLAIAYTFSRSRKHADVAVNTLRK